MSETSLFAELDRDELRRRAGQGAVLVFPVGAIEQHGPHLPTGTDTFGVERVAREAVALLTDRHSPSLPPVVLAPALAYGCSEHHLPFGGTLSVDAPTMLALVRSLGRSSVASGFTRILLLNGHGGNEDILRVAGRAIAQETGVVVASGSWFELARDRMLAVGADTLPRLPGHAGSFETSTVLVIRPELVANRTPRTPPPGAGPAPGPGALRVEDPGFWAAIEGFTDDPDQADADLGRRCLAVAAEVVADLIDDLARRPAAS